MCRPRFTGTIGPSAPESTMSPARSGRPRLAEFACEPGHRVQRIAEARGALPLRDDLFMPRHLHLHCAQIQARQDGVPVLPDNEESGGCVVGDGIDDGDIPFGDTAADDFERWHRKGVAPHHVGHSRRFDVDVPPSTKATSASIFGCSTRPTLDGLAFSDHHVGEQNAEVGTIDAELLLHGAARSGRSCCRPCVVRSPASERCSSCLWRRRRRLRARPTVAGWARSASRVRRRGCAPASSLYLVCWFIAILTCQSGGNRCGGG